MPWLLLQPVELSVEKRSSGCSDLLWTPEELPGTPPSHRQGEERQTCIKQLLRYPLCPVLVEGKSRLSVHLRRQQLLSVLQSPRSAPTSSQPRVPESRMDFTQ